MHWNVPPDGSATLVRVLDCWLNDCLAIVDPEGRVVGMYCGWARGGGTKWRSSIIRWLVKLFHYHQVFVVEVVHMEQYSESCPTPWIFETGICRGNQCVSLRWYCLWMVMFKLDNITRVKNVKPLVISPLVKGFSFVRNITINYHFKSHHHTHLSLVRITTFWWISFTTVTTTHAITWFVNVWEQRHVSDQKAAFLKLLMKLSGKMWPDLGKPSVWDPRAIRAMRVLVAQVEICQSPDIVVYMSNKPSSNCCHLQWRLVVLYEGEISLHFDPPSWHSQRTRSPLLWALIRILYLDTARFIELLYVRSPF